MRGVRELYPPKEQLHVGVLLMLIINNYQQQMKVQRSNSLPDFLRHEQGRQANDSYPDNAVTATSYKRHDFVLRSHSDDQSLRGGQPDVTSTRRMIRPQLACGDTDGKRAGILCRCTRALVCSATGTIVFGCSFCLLLTLVLSSSRFFCSAISITPERALATSGHSAC